MKDKYLSIAAVFLAAFIFRSITACAQPAKPTIDTTNVGWGWFDLKMTANSVMPANTEWLILRGSDTVFDTWRKVTDPNTPPGPRSRIPNDFVADTRDLLFKRIIGCNPAQEYIARVRYNNGSQWSAFSDPIIFTTPAEPQRSPEPKDTTFIILWGHSLLIYTDLFNVKTEGLINGNPDDGFVSLLNDHDAFGHALQTALRRKMDSAKSGRVVTIINGGVSGSLQYDWLRTGGSSLDADITFYDSGRRFDNTSRYPIAIFFFGQNDARDPFCGDMNHPPSQYSEDATTIIQRLTAKGIKVVYNSIHYATAVDCPDETLGWEGALRDRQEAYHGSWDSLMTTLVPSNSRLYRGADLYTLFGSDTARYLSPDGIHLNTSEAVPTLVDSLVRIISKVISSLSSVDDVRAHQSPLSLMVAPNITASTTQLQFELPIAGHATLEVFDALGRNIATVADGQMEAGVHSLSFDCSGLAGGMYIVRLRTNGAVVVQRLDVVR